MKNILKISDYKIVATLLVMVCSLLAANAQAYYPRSASSSANYDHGLRCAAEGMGRTIASGTVTVNHSIRADQPVSSLCLGDQITFDNTPTLTYNATGGSFDTPYGTWCDDNDSAACKDSINIDNGRTQYIQTSQSARAHVNDGYVHWTAEEVEPNMLSSNPGVMSCSGNTCTVTGVGSVSLTANIPSTEAKIWSVASVSESKYGGSADLAIAAGHMSRAILGRDRFAGSSKVYFSPSEEPGIPWLRGGWGYMDDYYSSWPSSVNYNSTANSCGASDVKKNLAIPTSSRPTWTLNINSCSTPGTCGSAHTSTSQTRPISNLCGSYDPANPPSPVFNTDTNQWEWTCSGSNEGASASCYAISRCADGTVLDPATNECVPIPVCGASPSPASPDRPTTGLCDIGTASAVSPNTENTAYEWTCTNPVGTVSCSQERTCTNPNSLICGGTCTTAVTVDTTTNLLRDGGAEPATIRIPDGLFCSLQTTTDTAPQVYGSGTYEVDVTAHPFDFAADCSCNRGGPESECIGGFDTLSGEACDEDDDDSKRITQDIACVCTARKCSSAGTCVGTPVFASSYSAGSCSSECSTDADCGGGSIRETGL